MTCHMRLGQKPSNNRRDIFEGDWIGILRVTTITTTFGDSIINTPPP